MERRLAPLAALAGATLVAVLAGILFRVTGVGRRLELGTIDWRTRWSSPEKGGLPEIVFLTIGEASLRALDALPDVGRWPWPRDVHATMVDALHYHVGVLATDDVNAFSAPGGYLFVTRGALRLMGDEAELAGVLAHEVAHVTERHVLNEIRRANLLGGALSMARTKGFSAAQYGVMADFGKNLLSKGLSRKDELAADSRGASFAVRAGYGSKGLMRFLGRLRERESARQGSVLFRTHPPAPDRLAALSASSEASAGADKPLADRFRRFLPAS